MKLLLAAILFLIPGITAAQWKIVDDSPAQNPKVPLIHEKKLVSKAGDSGFFASRRIDLIWFHADKHTFRVIDNGPIDHPNFPTLASAMRKNHCLAGVNGGFFLKDHSPSGLMVSGGSSIGKFGHGGLLSGVVLSSGNRNPYVLRRAEYGPAYKPTDLIQAGPFLVDQGKTVTGLSPRNSRRRSFVLHDGGKWFALGLSDAFTLAELGQILAQAEISPQRKIHRALNLDGGTSSGLFLDRGERVEPIHIEPFKTVRNFIGIVER
ncbi:MAG: phosphodiester glycosidase family protein [Verrucomicrobiales bacterium]|nr:phosphodiester glycosidase family protein [Verrucomicrobiales bacterium]